MTEKISFTVDDSFPPNSATASITTTQGETYEGHVDLLRGSVLNPMSMEELIEKFKHNASLAKHPVKDVDGLVETLAHLEDVVDVKDVVSTHLH